MSAHTRMESALNWTLTGHKLRAWVKTWSGLDGSQTKLLPQRGWRDKLKKSASWAEFAQEVKDRFVPSNWRMLALAAFYSIHQEPSSVLNFAKALQNARNALASAGQNWVVINALIKDHLLFFSHPNSPIYSNEKGVIKVPRVHPTPSPLVIPAIPAATSSTPPSSASSSAFVPLTHAEKEGLRAAGGCYHCRKTPQSPGPGECISSELVRLPSLHDIIRHAESETGRQ
ncbi:hypothetical protein GGX14DRAFT_391987 [Mycena pura]|uniref:Retrotransposon gag domain-containing protein n=1 Tax=Mycena pura TaxID=153505 RepID=A0AAD6VKG9_9AGAR|nr:hypothetical protein GGX14DRAFT_391987 [Mycena pura]